MENRPLSEIVAVLKEYYSRAIVCAEFLPAPADIEIRKAAELILRLLAERERYREALVMMYRKDCGLVADACDEIIDKSGALLGEIRKAALNQDKEAHDAAKKD